MKPVRVALVGCGAVARQNLLPVLAGHKGIALGPLVDRDENRARELARLYGVREVMTDGDRLDRTIVDAVVLATPPAHHAQAVIRFAAKGLHTFVEKPMAISAADACDMVQAAKQAGVVLSVGLYRRFLPAVQLLRELIHREQFGRVVAVDAEEGGPYGWPLASLDGLTRARGGGGVLIDIGSHVIDLILYVLGATPSLVRYRDNNRGGVETDCLLHASLQTAAGAVPLRLELSRTRELRGSIKVQCERATLELLRGNFTEILIHERSEPARNAVPIRFSAAWTNTGSFIGYDAFRREIDDFLRGITEGTEPVLAGRSVVPVVRLIEDAYGNSAAMAEPWTAEGLTSLQATRQPGARRRRVLVTGAGGFLGGRTVELLRERYGCDPVALVREPKSAARLARWPVEIVLGDICSRRDMDRVLQGCDAVVHCAVGTSWNPDDLRRVTVDGTRTLAEAALAAGIGRFVHISTMSVHRPTGAGILDETVPLEPEAANVYGQNKLLAEEAVRRVTAQGLSSIILRPARIYGPFSKTFIVRPLQALSEGRLAIDGDPEVPSNMVYVDNVVHAIARALEVSDVPGGSAYLINDVEQLSLRAFYEFFARVSGAPIRCVSRPPTDGKAGQPGLVTRWLNGCRTIALSPELRAMVHRTMNTDPVGALPRWLWNRSPEVQRRLLRLFGVDGAVVYRPTQDDINVELLYYHGDGALVSSARAERELGYSPPVSRERGMTLTLEWAQHARLVPAEPSLAAVSTVLTRLGQTEKDSSE